MYGVCYRHTNPIPEHLTKLQLWCIKLSRFNSATRGHGADPIECRVSFGVRIIHFLIPPSWPVFVAWQSLHSACRLLRSSVPPAALGLMWSTVVAIARLQPRHTGSRASTYARRRLQSAPAPQC